MYYNVCIRVNVDVRVLDVECNEVSDPVFERIVELDAELSRVLAELKEAVACMRVEKDAQSIVNLCLTGE